MRSGANIPVPLNREQLVSDCMYKTDLYEIKRWSFASQLKPVHGYNDCFCFVFVTSGAYSFSISRNVYDMHSGHVIVEKPNFEYSLFPASGKCTIINFSNPFYEKIRAEPLIKDNPFFSNPGIISQLILSNATIDYLHHKAVSGSSMACRMEMDDTVFELLYEVFSGFTGTGQLNFSKSGSPLHHLGIIERAKEYIHHNFKEDIGLPEIAENSFASPFHFSRIFRKFTLQSPYQYLLNVRLKHSEVLLKNSTIPVAAVAASSGFLNPDYFATAFKKKYKVIPTDYRRAKQ